MGGSVAERLLAGSGVARSLWKEPDWQGVIQETG